MDSQKVVQALQEIFDRCGTEIVQNRKKFISAVYDLLDEWTYKDERIVLKLAMESNAIPILLSTPQITSDAAERAVEQIRKEMHMDSEDAKFVVQCVVAACGFSPDIVTENEKRRQAEKIEQERIQKEEEQKRQKELRKQKREEKKRQEEERRQKEEEQKRKEEQKKQEEERKQREEEQKRQEEERKRREEEQKKQEEEQKQREEEQKKQEEERKQREEEQKRQEETDIAAKNSDNVNDKSKMKQILAAVPWAMFFGFLAYVIMCIIFEEEFFRKFRSEYCAGAAVSAVSAACWMQKVCRASKQKCMVYIKGFVLSVLWGIASFAVWYGIGFFVFVCVGLSDSGIQGQIFLWLITLIVSFGFCRLQKKVWMQIKMKQILAIVPWAMFFGFLAYAVLCIIAEEEFSEFESMYCAAAETIAVPAACWMQKVHKYMAYIKRFILSVLWGIASFAVWLVIVVSLEWEVYAQRQRLYWIAMYMVSFLFCWLQEKVWIQIMKHKKSE